MALDFHKMDDNEYLFGLNDSKYSNIEVIFIEYKRWTGTCINQYDDAKLTVDNQKTILKIIDIYINKTNLELNKQKTVDILEFRGLITYFSSKEIDIKIVGD